MDYVGLATLVLGVGALQILLDLGNDGTGSLDQDRGAGHRRRDLARRVRDLGTDRQDPIVDLRLFRHHNFTAGTVAMVVAYAAFFSVGILVPLWLQRNLGYTAIWAGSPPRRSASCRAADALRGPVRARFDLRVVASLAFVAMAITSFMRADFNLDVDFRTIAEVQLFQGLGVALFFMPVLTILLSDLEPHEIAAGSGLATFVRSLSAAVSPPR